jgi:hypothetical protein
MDVHRLRELESEKGTIQYGQSVTVPPSSGALAPGGGLQLLAKDLVRYRGDKTDLCALRVYLGPWVQQPSMPIPAAPDSPYAQPAPWLPPTPNLLDNFQGQFYAKVQWGAGGVQHVAFLDWPARGKLIQLSGSYVQVDAAVGVPSGALVDPHRLPTLRASLGFEPGGGDSVRPATFTYPKQAGALIGPVGAPTQRRWHFQVPPFARAFVPLVDVVNLFADATFGPQLRIAVQPSPAAIVGGGVPNIQSWVFLKAGVSTEGLDWPLEPFPIAGQTICPVDLATAQEGAVVTIEIDETALAAPFDFARAIGCMFDLDL